MRFGVGLVSLGVLVIIAGCGQTGSKEVASVVPRAPAETGPVLVAVSDEPIIVGQELGIEFDMEVELVGISVPAEVKRGEPFEVEQVWHCVELTDRDWRIALHFDYPNPFWRLNRDHRSPIATSDWEKGQYISWKITVILPPEAPLGEYRINIHPYEIVPGTEPKEIVPGFMTVAPEVQYGMFTLVEP